MPSTPQTYGSVLGREISAARGRLQLTQTSVAARMDALGFDWHQQTVANVEKGKRRITAEELLFLSYALQTTVAALGTPAGDDFVVELPSGARIAAASISRSARGQRDHAIDWDGNKPVFAEAALEQMVAMGIADYTRVNSSTGEVRHQDPATGEWVLQEDGTK